MKNKTRVTLLMTAAVLLTMLLMVAERGEDQPVMALRGVRAVQQDIYNSIYAPGEVEAARGRDYTSAHAATVTEIYVKPGDKVAAGQQLVRLRETALALPDDAIQTFAEGVMEGETGDPAALASALRDAAQTEETDYVVTAEEAGTVLRAPEAVGEGVLPGLSYLKTADTGTLRVRAQIPETYIRQVREGQRANVTSDADPDGTVAAKVTVVAPYARRAASLTGQKQAATVEAVLALVGRQEGLRPGYTVSVKIFTDAVADAVLVPYEAVSQEGDREYVFVVRDSIAHKLYVETGYELDGYVQIAAGIDAGDIVLVSPPADLKDGDRVEVSGV